MEQDERPDDLGFEEAIARLEEVARRLEDPDTPLDEAVSLYEDGVRLARLCAKRLQEAELKVEALRIDEDAEHETPSDD